MAGEARAFAVKITFS